MDSSGPKTWPAHQNVVVMRHGHRMDFLVQDWVKTAKRPWDPPLVKEGVDQAFDTGLRRRNELGFPIHRVLVSPFLRCVQTASEAISALCAVDAPRPLLSDDVIIDPSKLKLPRWGGTEEDARERYIKIFNALADKYPTENLLLVTHGKGVEVAVSAFKKGAAVHRVDYCAFAKLRRPIFHKDQSFSAGSFEVFTGDGEDGVYYISSAAKGDDANEAG